MYRVLLVDDEPAIIMSEKRAIMKRAKEFEVVGEAYDVKKAIYCITNSSLMLY